MYAPSISHLTILCSMLRSENRWQVQIEIVWSEAVRFLCPVPRNVMPITAFPTIRTPESSCVESRGRSQRYQRNERKELVANLLQNHCSLEAEKSKNVNSWKWIFLRCFTVPKGTEHTWFRLKHGCFVRGDWAGQSLYRYEVQMLIAWTIPVGQSSSVMMGSILLMSC